MLIETRQLDACSGLSEILSAKSNVFPDALHKSNLRRVAYHLQLVILANVMNRKAVVAGVYRPAAIGGDMVVADTSSQACRSDRSSVSYSVHGV